PRGPAGSAPFPYTTLFRSGAGVDERGRVLHRLHEVGHDGLVEDDGHGPLGVEVARAHHAAIVVVADDDLAEAPLEVRPRGGQGEDRKSTRLNSSHVKISYA